MFWWGFPSFKFLIHNINSTSSPTLTYCNIFLFTNAFLHFLIYSFNVTFSATLTYFNLFLFTTFPFHFFVCILGINFIPHLRTPISSSSLLLALLHFGIYALKFELEMLHVARLVRFFSQTAFFGECLDVTSFFLFLTFFSLFSISTYASPWFLNWFFYCIYQNKNFIHI